MKLMLELDKRLSTTKRLFFFKEMNFEAKQVDINYSVGLNLLLNLLGLVVFKYYFCCLNSSLSLFERLLKHQVHNFVSSLRHNLNTFEPHGLKSWNSTFHTAEEETQKNSGTSFWLAMCSSRYS